MSPRRSIGAIRNFARLGLVLAVLIGLLGHAAMGGESDCAPNGAVASAVVVLAPGHPVSIADHALAHAHTHDVSTAAQHFAVAVAQRAQTWSATAASVLASASTRDIERPPRHILLG